MRWLGVLPVSSFTFTNRPERDTNSSFASSSTVKVRIVKILGDEAFHPLPERSRRQVKDIILHLQIDSPLDRILHRCRLLPFGICRRVPFLRICRCAPLRGRLSHRRDVPPAELPGKVHEQHQLHEQQCGVCQAQRQQEPRLGEQGVHMHHYGSTNIHRFAVIAKLSIYKTIFLDSWIFLL